MKSFQKITILLNFNLPQLLLFLFFLLLLPHQEPPEDFELLPHPPLLLRRPGSGLASLKSKTKARVIKMQIAKVTLIFGEGTSLGRLYYILRIFFFKKNLERKDIYEIIMLEMGIYFNNSEVN